MSAGDFVFGIMGAHTRQCRDFSEQDIHFLEAIANILTIAVLRWQAVEALDQVNMGLQETRRYLTSLMETSTDAIVSTSQEGDVVLCNKGTNTLLGYREEELIGHSVEVLYESEEEAAELMRQMREGGGTAEGFETTLRAKDGNLIPVLTSASIFYDQEGQEAGTVRFSRDLRERKRLEDELRMATEEVQKAHDSLERAQKTAIAAQKLEAMGRLTAGVFHEIQSPLNVITMRLQMMISDPDTSPEFDRHLRTLLEQAERVVKITQELLHLGRQRKPERHQFDLNELIRRTLGLLEHDLRQRNIRVVLEFAQDLQTVWGVEDGLTQVVLNLLTNARDVMPKGGQLGLSTADVQADDRKFVELRVEDTGEGIAPEHLKKIFDPFFTTKPEGEGTGLGLYICRGIIEAHGGDMWAESAPGGGAAFIARLPLRNRDA
jgi:PAS domain S-box-containing protein